MTIGAFINGSTKRLAAAGVMTARLDCLVLLEDELGKDRASMLAHLNQEIDHPSLLKLNNKITRRCQHVPLAYMRGKTDFYGRDFFVNEQVLVPRPESEALIDLLKKAALPGRPRIADVGCGSGCLGITAALEIIGSELHFYDIDEAALKITKRNAWHYKLHKQQYYWQNLLEQAFGPYDAVLANLPYVPEGHALNEAARHEPTIALFGGQDGLDIYRKLWQQVCAMNTKPRFVVTESFPFQHRQNAQLAKTAGYSLETTDDFAQRFILN